VRAQGKRHQPADEHVLPRIQVPTQTGTMASGAPDRPGPQRRVVVRELHELGIALGCRLNRDLAEDATARSVEDRRGVGVDVGVDADDDIDHPAQFGQTQPRGQSTAHRG